MSTGNQSSKATNRNIGLGQIKNPAQLKDAGFLGALIKCPFNSVPVNEYTRWTTTIPLTKKDAAGAFGTKVKPLQSSDDPVPGILNVSSSFIVGGILQCHMICAGIGIHVWGEPISFTAEGVSYLAAATAPIATLDVHTENDIVNNAMGSTTVAGGTPTPAILEWGFCSWMAAWETAHAYEVNWWFNQRYTLLKEPLSDVCYFGPYAECDGAGTSSVSAQQYFKQVNDDYQGPTLGSLRVISPVFFQRLGSITVAGNNVASVRPTRNFDEVDVTFGGLRNQGQAGCGSPFRKFTCPVFIEKGIPIGLELQQSDVYHWGQMQRYLSASEDGAAIPASVPFTSIPALQTLTTAGAAGVTAAEQTLDAVTAVVTQQVQTVREYFKGGSYEMEFLLKGWEMNDRAWIDQINAAISQGLMCNASSSTGLALLPRDMTV